MARVSRRSRITVCLTRIWAGLKPSQKVIAMKLFGPRIAAVSAVARCRSNHPRAFSKPIFVFAVLLWAAAASSSLAITYTTLDDPLGTNGTQALGIDGNRIVGLYTTPSIHGYLYNGASFTTLDPPLT